MRVVHIEQKGLYAVLKDDNGVVTLQALENGKLKEHDIIRLDSDNPRIQPTHLVYETPRKPIV